MALLICSFQPSVIQYRAHELANSEDDGVFSTNRGKKMSSKLTPTKSSREKIKVRRKEVDTTLCLEITSNSYEEAQDLGKPQGDKT